METNLKTEMALATIRNCNITLGNFKSLKTPVGRLLQIELIVMFTTFMFLLLITFSSQRRRCNGQKFGQFIYMVYNLSTFLLTYSLSLMHDFPSRNKLFPIWAMLLMITFGSTDSISVDSLDDNEQWKRNNWQLLTKSIWLVWLINLYFCDGSEVVVAAECLFIVLAAKFWERAWAVMVASRHSLERNAKVLADFMKEEHESGGVSHGEVDPVSMRWYTYLVWGDEGSLLSSATDYFLDFLSCVGIDVNHAQPPHYRVPLLGYNLITIEKVYLQSSDNFYFSEL